MSNNNKPKSMWLRLQRLTEDKLPTLSREQLVALFEDLWSFMTSLNIDNKKLADRLSALEAQKVGEVKVGEDTFMYRKPSADAAPKPVIAIDPGCIGETGVYAYRVDHEWSDKPAPSNPAPSNPAPSNEIELPAADFDLLFQRTDDAYDLPHNVEQDWNDAGDKWETQNDNAWIKIGSTTFVRARSQSEEKK